MKNYKSAFMWSEDTVNYFFNLSKEIPANELTYKVMDFVEADCMTEEDETFQDLYEDLMQVILTKIYNQLSNK